MSRQHKTPEPWSDKDEREWQDLGNQRVDASFKSSSIATSGVDFATLSDAEFARQYHLIGAADSSFANAKAEADRLAMGLDSGRLLGANEQDQRRPLFPQPVSTPRHIAPRSGNNYDVWRSSEDES